VNHQINLYVFSRITMGIVRTMVENGYLKNNQYAYRVFAAVSWAVVMWLFEFHGKNLQGSLRKSMLYLYHNEKLLSESKSIWDWFIE